MLCVPMFYSDLHIVLIVPHSQLPGYHCLDYETMIEKYLVSLLFLFIIVLC